MTTLPEGSVINVAELGAKWILLGGVWYEASTARPLNSEELARVDEAISLYAEKLSSGACKWEATEVTIRGTRVPRSTRVLD